MFAPLDDDILDGPLLARTFPDLTPTQQEWATHPHPRLCLMAGAGTGKTTVLVSRLVHWLENEGFSPRRLLAITFTNKAAQELQERLAAKVPNAKGAWVGTFHSLCFRFLMRHTPEPFSILSEAEQHGVLKTAMDALIEEDNQGDRHFLNQKGGLSHRSALSRFSVAISAYKNQEYRGEGPTLLPGSFEAPEAQCFLERLYRAYQAVLRDEKLKDFDDLLQDTVTLMIENNLAASTFFTRFQGIAVDEVQDINGLQKRFLSVLGKTAPRAQWLLVGDEDQAIYGFRGSQSRWMKALADELTMHAGVLVENFRCPQRIVEKAAALVSHNTRFYEKTLFSRKPVPCGYPGAVVKAYENDLKEAEGVALWLCEHRLKHPEDRIAVLVRSYRQERLIGVACAKQGVPLVSEGRRRFFQAPAMAALLAYLKVLVDLTDETALMAILNVPKRGIGPQRRAAWKKAAKAQGVTVIEWLWQQVEGGPQCAEVDALMAPVGAAPVGFLEGILVCEEAMSTQSFLTFLETVGTMSGYRDCAAFDTESEPEDGWENGVDLNLKARQHRWSDFLAQARRFETEANAKGGVGAMAEHYLRGFVADCALTSAEDDAAPTVRLMSVHAAKGLEFDAVAIPGCEEGTFPHARALDDPEAIEEERRLMYVALTRAKKTVWLAFARQREALWGRTAGAEASPESAQKTRSLMMEKKTPSRFLAEAGLKSNVVPLPLRSAPASAVLC
jgi:DNA helicase II / ATP-dependent DNA helicase PcrA